MIKRLNIEVKALLGDTVSVKTLELKAVIIGVYVSRCSIGYEIAYFHNGDRKTAYLFDHEFELVTP